MKRALISVSDKTGIVEFAEKLNSLGYEIISTGGTLEMLRKHGVPAISISEVTGFPECLDGRVKTLHPAVHGGILARRDDPSHMKTLEELGIKTIDMVVVNLYPFKKTIIKPGATFEEAVENIDIGGPTMLRSAAKNHTDVAVITDPADYSKVISEISEEGDVMHETRLTLAYKVFAHTAAYDALIAEYLREKAGIGGMPETLTLTYEKSQELRYGENPFQKAAFYREPAGRITGLADAAQLHGKELSFNNINDANGAIELLREFSTPVVVAVKHANPCGVACGGSIYEAYMKAYNADPVSIFGGIVAVNGEIDEKTAGEINRIFLEIVIAPSYSEEALAILKQKKNIRLLLMPSAGIGTAAENYDIKKVLGGILYQTYDNELFNDDEIRCVTKATPTAAQLQDLKFAMTVVKHVKSNGIAVAKDMMTIGVGPGQLNRISAVEIALKAAKANGHDCSGAVLASDAYFPFSDCVQAAYEAGIKAIMQPGGSLKDQESVELCDKYGIAMVFTGKRHFKH